MTKTTTVSALLILAICCSAITACAQSRLPPASPPSAEHRTTEEAGEQAAAAADAAALAGADAAEAAVGHALAPENNNGATERKVMDANKEIEPTIPSGPPIPTDLLLNRILALLDSLRSPKDVSRVNVARMMEVKFRENDERDGHWYFNGITNAGWTYDVYVDESTRRELPGITIYFPAGDVPRGTNPSVCTYELEAFAERLVTMGYSRFPGWRQPRAHLGFDRQAKGSRFGVGIHVFKYVQQTGPEEEDYRYCVSSIDISAGESVDAE
jgi:hypothetical protein